MEATERAPAGDGTGPAGRDWLATGVFWMLAVAVIGLTWPTWVALAGVWSHQFGYTHGFLVAAIVVWLVWRALGRVADGPVPAAWMLPAVAITSFLWQFLRLASVRTLEEVAATLLLWTAAAAVLGWRWGRALLLPLAFLLFAVPLWEGLVPLLQPLTAAATGTICQLIGIPTYLEGNIVHIPGGVFAIEEGCAGSHYFVASVTLAGLYAYLEYRRWWQALTLIGLSAVLAIVSNWIRVVLVIRAGHTAGMQHPWVKDHNMVGWVLFAVALIPLFAVAQRLEHATSPPEAVEAPGKRAARLGTIAATFLLMLAAVGWPRALTLLLQGREVITPSASLTAPPARGGWRGPLAPDVDWIPSFPAADAQVRSAYEKDGRRVTLFCAHYAAQAEGREVIGYDDRLEGREGWRVARDEPLRGTDLGPWRRSELIRGEARQRVVLYRYLIAGRPTASRLEAKLRQGLSGFTRDRSASILAASAPCRDSCDPAYASVTAFLREMQPACVTSRSPS